MVSPSCSRRALIFLPSFAKPVSTAVSTGGELAGMMFLIVYPRVGELRRCGVGLGGSRALLQPQRDAQPVGVHADAAVDHREGVQQSDQVVSSGGIVGGLAWGVAIERG